MNTQPAATTASATSKPTLSRVPSIRMGSSALSPNSFDLREVEALGIAPRVVDEQRQHQRRDVHEHQRRQDLVRVEARAQPRRDRGPRRAAEDAREHHQRQHERRLAAVQRERDAAAGDRAQRELAFGADVPDVGAVAGREPRRDQHQRRRLEQELADAVERVDRLHEERVERVERVLPHRGEQHEADRDRRQGGDQRRRPAERARRLGTRFEADHRVGRRRADPIAPAGEKRRSDCVPGAMNEPRHQHADLLGVGFARRARFGEAALRDHGEAVADLEQLVELLGDDEHRDAARRAGRSAPGGSARRRRRRRPTSAAPRSSPSAPAGSRGRRCTSAGCRPTATAPPRPARRP